MKILLINHSLPAKNTNGGPMTVWAIMKHLVNLGHEVELIAIKKDGDPFFTQERSQAILEIGVRLHAFELDSPNVTPTINKWFHRWIPKREHIFPEANYSEKMGELVRQIAPDRIFAYHWDSLATLVDVSDVPKIGAMGDPWYAPQFRVWKRNPWIKNLIAPRKFIGRIFFKLSCIYQMHELLRGCTIAGSFQADETRKLRKVKGLAAVKYYRTPLVTPDIPTKYDRVAAIPTILIGPSNLNATSTQAGLIHFAEDIYPLLRKRCKDLDFQVRIVGEGNPPDALKSILNDNRIQICGRVEPPDEEFLNATAQLVPTPFVLGIRVRIICGFSFGCCVITRETETKNIPELKHQENALIGHNAEELAEHLERVIKEPEFAKTIGDNARRIFLEKFSLPSAAKAVCEDILR